MEVPGGRGVGKSQVFFHVMLPSPNDPCYCLRFILKRLFQYQAAAEAGVFQAPPYAPFPPDILPPVMLPPYVMDKVKAPKVKAKRAAAKPKTDKEAKVSTAAAAKAQKAATDSAGLYCQYQCRCALVSKLYKPLKWPL